MESAPHIHFKNQPKLSDLEADQKFNERRLELISQIEHFVNNDELFRGKKIEIEFSHKGVSSLVTFITADDEKYVLKIPISTMGYGGEAEFLKAWEGEDVAVPHVFREGKFGENDYLLMTHIDAPNLSDVLDHGLKKNISIEMGKILRKMHKPQARGYGFVFDGVPEHQSFREWILDKKIQKRIQYVQENKGLDDETHGSISKATDILIEYAKKHPHTSYCHFDYGSSNMLATEPLTIIDPDPMMNIGMIDIGRSMLLAIAGGHEDAAEKLKKGYFEGEHCDEQALQAAIILNAYWKVAHWLKRGKAKAKSIENIQKYLEKTADLL